MIGAIELVNQYFCREYVATYDPNESMSVMIRMLYFLQLLNWTSLTKTLAFAVSSQFLLYTWITFVTIDNNSAIADDEKAECIRRYLGNFIIVILGELTLHYIKLRSISGLII